MTNFNYEGYYEVGISFYFWIIRLVNTQLALYSHARCNPINCHWHPWNTPEQPHMTITNFTYDNDKFQLWGLIWGGNFVLFLKK